MSFNTDLFDGWYVWVYADKPPPPREIEYESVAILLWMHSLFAAAKLPPEE